MLDMIREYLATEGICLFSPIALRDCRVTRPYLLSRAGIEDGTAIMLAIPYAVRTAGTRNVSAYAVSRDYHLCFEELFSRLIPQLRNRFPDWKFVGFADHSPIHEIDAAIRAGLGVRGDNGLLLTELYSSYIFIGELITDAHLPTPPPSYGECHHCGACRRACPVGLDYSQCLSALTQKKGELSEEELSRLDAHPLVWGCDTCQEVCPYTIAAIRKGTLYDALPFFHTAPIPQLSVTVLDEMDEDTFRARAYAWRGRAVIRRNLLRKEDKEQT